MLTAALATCGPSGSAEQLAVSVIGAEPKPGGDAAPSAVLSRAVAQGLVRFDEAGVVTPGLADRWIVLDEGRTIIFRLADARWTDGSRVTAANVRAQLRRRLAQSPDDPTVGAVAAAVEDITAVIPAILELHLKAERPDLLSLLAQPAFALTDDGGSGPWQATRSADGWRTLGRVADDAAEDRARSPTVRLRADDAATALARYAEGEVDVVLGGGWGAWPYARTKAAGVSDALLIDPTEGLFGLRVARREGLLADVEGRAALAGALNRADLASRLGLSEGWARTTLVAGVPPSIWADGTQAERLERGRSVVQRWRQANGESAPTVTLATSTDPGGRVLAAWLTRQWAAIGVEVRQVARGTAQLTVIDAVAPSPDPASTLELIGCGSGTPCDDAASSALAELARQTTLVGWRTARADAYRALSADLPVLPLGRPLRWSVVRPGVPGAVANARAVHPLTRMAPAASREE